MALIQTLFSDRPRPYTGVELRPHFLLSELGLKGSALGAFIGPCRVETEHLVDWEDRLAHDRIEGKLMIHFIGEFFGATLKEGVLRQRLFMSQIRDEVSARLREQRSLEPVLRRGDDLFVLERKLSVSIVTASPVSQLLHVGINIDPSGAPVPAIGLAELGIDPPHLIESVLKGFAEEWESMEWACAKVRPVL